MTSKRKSASKMRAPAMRFESRFGSTLFQQDDLPKLAKAAELPLLAASPSMVLMNLTWAFEKAHVAEITARSQPPAGELLDGYETAAAAGREFLLALGMDAEPAVIVRSAYSDILDQSTILRKLVQWAPSNTSEVLHQEVVDAMAPQYSLPKQQRRTLAAQRQVVESARVVAYIVVTADAARNTLPRPKRRGPPKAAFAPVLLEELIKCYWEMFEKLPTVKRIEGSNRGGPAVHWLRQVLQIANIRLASTPYAMTVGANSIEKAPHDELLAEVQKLTEFISIETLGSAFEKVIARVKRRYRGVIG